MAADDLKELNIQRFERLLVFECNPSRRALIHRLLAEELRRADAPHPVEQPAIVAGAQIH